MCFFKIYFISCISHCEGVYNWAEDPGFSARATAALYPLSSPTPLTLVIIIIRVVLCLLLKMCQLLDTSMRYLLFLLHTWRKKVWWLISVVNLMKWEFPEMRFWPPRHAVADCLGHTNWGEKSVSLWIVPFSRRNFWSYLKRP